MRTTSKTMTTTELYLSCCCCTSCGGDFYLTLCGINCVMAFDAFMCLTWVSKKRIPPVSCLLYLILASFCFLAVCFALFILPSSSSSSCLSLPPSSLSLSLSLVLLSKTYRCLASLSRCVVQCVWSSILAAIWRNRGRARHTQRQTLGSHSFLLVLLLFVLLTDSSSAGISICFYSRLRHWYPFLSSSSRRKKKGHSFSFLGFLPSLLLLLLLLRLLI